MGRRRSLVSIHDVMPETLDRVQELLDLARGRGVERLTLLVVPGLAWTDEGLARVRAWADAGHELAGHGWTHRARTIRGLRHRLHSLFVSRDCAEHLALDGDEIVAMLRRCRAWFGAHDLPTPTLYVPPAWALGPVRLEQLRATGFEALETMGGLHELSTGRTHRLPLVGYEARAAWQVPVLTVSNAFNGLLAGRRWRRIAIHPDDHRLALRHALESALGRAGTTKTYAEFLA